MPASGTARVSENLTFDAAQLRWNFEPESRFIIRVEAEPAVQPQVTGIQVALIGLISPDWKLIQPLIITIEPDGEGYVASDEIFFMYGLGTDRSEALKDYISVLTEYYELIASHGDAPTVELFDYLKSFLVKR